MVREGVKSVYTYCDANLVKKIKVEASKCGLSVSSWIRQIIIKELTK